MSDPTVRRLVVVRHAKSDYPPGVPDRERPLGERGRRDAPRMGLRIAALTPQVDLALVSPATRTQQTWDLLSPSLDVAEMRLEGRIYQAWGAQMMGVVRGLDDSVRCAMLVGHEPGVSHLVVSLADHGRQETSESADLLRTLRTKFPTCAVAVLELEESWSQAGRGAVRLSAFLTPKDQG